MQNLCHYAQVKKMLSVKKNIDISGFVYLILFISLNKLLQNYYRFNQVVSVSLKQQSVELKYK